MESIDYLTMIRKMMSSFLYKSLSYELQKMLGEKSTVILLRNVAKRASKDLVEQGLVKVKDIEESLTFCFRMEGFTDQDFRLLKGEDYIVEVYKCPYEEYVKENPVGCWICVGLKMGFLESVLGREVGIDVKDRPALIKEQTIAEGHDKCIIRLLL